MIQVVLTMDTLDLVPFERTQLQRVEDFDASKFHIKELRIKDLHKNLCKKPYFHVRLDSQKRTTSAAEQAEPNGEQRRSSLITSDAEYETCEEDGVASVPQDLTLPPPSEKTSREEFPGEEQEPSHRHSKRKTRLPGKFRHDDSILSDFSERYAKYYKRAVPKSKVKLSRLEEKLPPIQTQFFEVPIEAHEVDVLQGDASGGEPIGLASSKVADSNPCTPSERKASTKPLKQVYHAPSSGHRRHPPTTKHSKVRVDYTECMQVSSDSDPREGPSRKPNHSSLKWKHSSLDATAWTEALSTGKRALDSKSKEKGSRSTNGSKPNENKGRPLESELELTFTALDGSTEKVMPIRWRPNSPDASASVEEIMPTEKKRTFESKVKEKKNRLNDSKAKEKNGRTFESEWKRSYNAPPQARTEEPIPTKWRHTSSDASVGKRAFEGRSKEKERMTVENKWIEKKGQIPETESKQRHSAADGREEEILSMKWRLPKEQLPFESKWKEKNRMSSATSTEKILPLKRKRSHIEDPGVEEDISLPEKKKTADGKLKEKGSKTPAKEKKAKTSESEGKLNSNGSKAKDTKRSRKVGTAIRKLKSGYTSEDGTSDVERDAADGPGTIHPTFATEMKHSNVVTCFWMGIPADFSSRHMPDHDQFVILQDAKGLKWEANYLARKKGLSGGWRRFALDHHLDMGDIVVFELVKPHKFLVHITKVFGVENTTDTVHRPARETPKKAEKPKHQGSTSTKRASLESALPKKAEKPKHQGSTSTKRASLESALPKKAEKPKHQGSTSTKRASLESALPKKAEKPKHQGSTSTKRASLESALPKKAEKPKHQGSTSTKRASLESALPKKAEKPNHQGSASTKRASLESALPKKAEKPNHQGSASTKRASLESALPKKAEKPNHQGSTSTKGASLESALPKKAEKPKHQDPTLTKRASLESALFSSRKRANRDAEGKLPTSKKPRLAGDSHQRRDGEERAKPNLFNSGEPKKKERQSASKETKRSENSYTLLSSGGEKSEGEEEGRQRQRARASLSKLKHLSSKGDDRKDANNRKNSSPELPLTVYEKSPNMPSVEPQKVGPFSPKPGPPKKKLRRVSYFYPTDENQG